MVTIIMSYFMWLLDICIEIFAKFYSATDDIAKVA